MSWNNSSSLTEREIPTPDHIVRENDSIGVRTCHIVAVAEEILDASESCDGLRGVLLDEALPHVHTTKPLSVY